MARNTTPIIIGAVLFGLLAIGLTFFVLTGGGGGPAQPVVDAQPTPEPERSVWVARRTIYPRTLITRDMLAPSSNSDAPANAVTDPDDVIGQIASRTIRASETITADAVTNPVARVIPANIPIPVGLRAVAVWVNPDETVAGLVDVGDRVDVIATHELRIEKQGGQIIVGATEFTAGRTVAQNLEVLAVDDSIRQYRPTSPATPDAPAGQAGQPGQPGQPTDPAAAQPGAQPGAAQGGQTTAPPANQPPNQRRFIRVVLAAPPNEAQRIIAANDQGEIHLTIRNPVSNDEFPLGEAREYPSRVAGRPTTGAQTVSAQERREARRERLGAEVLKAAFTRDAQTTTVTPAIPAPTMNGVSQPAGPPPSYNKEVTVIRGTEKTRVLVPR